jgi:hypothetical protein
MTEEERLIASLPSVLTEVAGRAIKEWQPNELVAMGVVVKLASAQRIVAQGFMKPHPTPNRARKAELARILKELGEYAWQASAESEVVVVPRNIHDLEKLREHLLREEGVYIRALLVLERAMAKGYLTINGRLRPKS